MEEAVQRIHKCIKNGDTILSLCNLTLTYLPNILPRSLTYLYCYNNKYLHITQQMANKYRLSKTPNYIMLASRIQLFWKHKRNIIKMQLTEKIDEHSQEFIYKPDNFGYLMTKLHFTSLLSIS